MHQFLVQFNTVRQYWCSARSVHALNNVKLYGSTLSFHYLSNKIIFERKTLKIEKLLYWGGGGGGWRDAFSLYIDGLPMEMTWDWLLKIFRGEREVIDVHVSQKRRRNNNCWFGLFGFKKLDKASNAVRNLNDVKIREKSLKVFFC